MIFNDRLVRRLHRLRIGRRLMWLIAQWIFTERTVTTGQGRLTFATADNVIGKKLYIHREFESAWVDKALGFLRQTGRLPMRGSGTVLDIGANMGVISIGMLHTGEFEKAVAIEPDPNNYQFLQRNARQNDLGDDRYVCVPRALSDHEGETEFELSPDNYGDHRVRAVTATAYSGSRRRDRYDESRRRTIRVPMETLDQLITRLPEQVSRDIALVWIDTQGHEGRVFAGGQTLFSKNIPVVSEVWPYGIQRSGMSLPEFCRIAASYWSSYWVLTQPRTLANRPISTLNRYLDELGDEGRGDNVIFTQ